MKLFIISADLRDHSTRYAEKVTQSFRECNHSPSRDYGICTVDNIYFSAKASR